MKRGGGNLVLLAQISLLIEMMLSCKILHFCSLAICDGKTNVNGACNRYYSNDYQKIKSTGIERNSGGTCSSPDYCSNCNDGFYSNGPYCDSKHAAILMELYYL